MPFCGSKRKGLELMRMRWMKRNNWSSAFDVTNSVARSIEVGKIGTFAFDQRKGKSSEEGCHLIEFIGLPQTV